MAWMASTLKLEKVEPPSLGVADFCAVEGEGGFDAALAVDGELRGEVGAVGVGGGADGEQEEGGEVTLVEGNFADGGARELLARALAGGLGLDCGEEEGVAVGDGKGDGAGLWGEDEGAREVEDVAGDVDGENVAGGREDGEVEATVGVGGGGLGGGAGREGEAGVRKRHAVRVEEGAGPGCGRGVGGLGLLGRLRDGEGGDREDDGQAVDSGESRGRRAEVEHEG